MTENWPALDMLGQYEKLARSYDIPDKLETVAEQIRKDGITQDTLTALEKVVDDTKKLLFKKLAASAGDDPMSSDDEQEAEPKGYRETSASGSNR